MVRRTRKPATKAESTALGRVRKRDRVRVEVATGVDTSTYQEVLNFPLKEATTVEEIRDYLYTRMRGSRDRSSPASQVPVEGVAVDAAAMREVANSLREVAAELRAVREALDGRERGELP